MPPNHPRGLSIRGSLIHVGSRGRSPICMAAALALVACGGGEAGSSSTPVVVVSSGSTSPTPNTPPAPMATSTTTPAPAATDTIARTLDGVDPIASGIDINSYLQRSWGSGDIPATMRPDVVGAFRFDCTPSHNAYDDPIVYPGQTGKSHLHTFFGNTKTNAFSTYQSLRTSGDSSCNNMLNRSAYWMPSMMSPSGKVVMPNFLSVYYKRRPDTDPECQREGAACISLPRGLRYIFGYNMSNPANSSLPEFVCNDNNSVTGTFRTIPEAAKVCRVGAMLGARLSSPSCWNGRELDSADHRSHMAYPSYGDWGYEKCPSTHPYVVPTFTMAAFYIIDASLDLSGDMSADAKTWYLSSDRMAGMPWQTPGSTLHADWFGAWEDSVMKTWTEHCVNQLLSCSGGDLGDGQQLKMMTGYNWGTTTQYVDAPVKP
jgi:hypothetical protein